MMSLRIRADELLLRRAASLLTEYAARLVTQEAERLKQSTEDLVKILDDAAARVSSLDSHQI